MPGVPGADSLVITPGHMNEWPVGNTVPWFGIVHFPFLHVQLLPLLRRPGHCAASIAALKEDGYLTVGIAFR